MADASAATVHRSAPADPAMPPRRGLRTLQLRILSSLVLAPIAIGAVWFGWPWLPLLTAAAAAVMAWEWDRLCRTERSGTVALAAMPPGILALQPSGLVLVVVVLAAVIAAAVAATGIGIGLSVAGAAAVFIIAERERRCPPDLARIGCPMDCAALRLAAVAGASRRIRAAPLCCGFSQSSGQPISALMASAASSAVRVSRRAGARARPGPGSSAASSAPRLSAGPPRDCLADRQFYPW